MILVLFNTSAFGKVIGDVILQEGNSVVERKEGDEFDSKIDLDIFSYDTVDGRNRPSKFRDEVLKTLYSGPGMSYSHADPAAAGAHASTVSSAAT